MDTVLWIGQVILGISFLTACLVHAVLWEMTSKLPDFKWMADIGHTRSLGIGLLEVSGGIGVVAPAATGILVWLTPLAALGLTLLMVSASVFHIVRREPRNLALAAALGLLAAFVTFGRYVLVPF